MPHIVVKMYPGRSDAQKTRIADALTGALVAAAPCGADAVSVSIEDVAPGDWVEKVYRPEIIGKPGQLYKKPGYDPL